MKTNEHIVVVHWEGPYSWDDCVNCKKDGHVLYALHGAHHLYGNDVLLYLGRSYANVGSRMKDHDEWVAEEYDAVTVRYASVGDLKDAKWQDWMKGDRYSRAKPTLVEQVEALLIYAHQPAYNSMSKGSVAVAKGLRILNTGRLGHLLPEISYLYHVGD
jgi:hypothetical protein